MRHSSPKRNERPVVLLDLSSAIDDLSLLIFSASAWMPEDDWKPLAEEMHTFAQAALDRFVNLAEKNSPALAADPEDLGSCILRTLAGMRKALAGRFRRLEGNHIRQETKELERLYDLGREFEPSDGS